MKLKRITSALLAIAMCITLVGCGGGTADKGETQQEQENNLIPGGDFKESDSHWGIYTESGGSGTYSVTGGELVVDIAAPGRVGHGVQMYCTGFEMLQGATYEMSFDVSSTVERTIEWRIQYDSGDYHAYAGDASVSVGTEMQTFTFQFEMTEASDPSPKLCFNIGDQDQAQGLGEHELHFDNVCLKVLDDSNAQAVDLNVDDRNINLNQIGYRPTDTKYGILRDLTVDDSFEVINAESNEVVYSGKVEETTRAGSSGETVGLCDFTELQTPGTYFLRAKNSGDSHTFTIADDVYDAVFNDALKMLYMQRCGMKLTEDLAGDFAHAKCHSELATIYGTEETIDVSGGWHDAGDYGRYVVPGAKTVADLLLAYERAPEQFSDAVGIPESDNGIPDVLDEARYELEWMLKMQGADGGVYHKVTTAQFGGVCMPEDNTDPLIVLPASKTATMDFAAVMYMAYRVYGSVDKNFANTCKAAADRCFGYYNDHVNDKNYTNPEGIDTGEYEDGTSKDEYLWALCEGYKSTGDASFLEQIKAMDLSVLDELHGLGWQGVTEYAYYAYLTSQNRDADLEETIKSEFFEYVDEAKDNAMKEAYHSSIIGDYPWGSNMTIANNGMVFYMAYDITGDESYLLPAKFQLDYLMGCNTNSYCFITGYGGLYPENPHHRPSQAIGKAVPGMLVGGPNSGLNDPYAKTVLDGQKNAHCYVDSDQSYSCNEITIYWNSPLIYLLAAVMD